MLLVQGKKLIAGSDIQHEIDVPLENLRESHGEIVWKPNGLAGQKQTVVDDPMFKGKDFFGFNVTFFADEPLALSRVKTILSEGPADRLTR